MIDQRHLNDTHLFIVVLNQDPVRTRRRKIDIHFRVFNFPFSIIAIIRNVYALKVS